MKPELIIEISGGVLVDIKSNMACDICVLDHDNMKAGDDPQLWTTDPEDIDASAEYLKNLEECAKNRQS